MPERRTIPARTARDRSRDDDSLLLRSAESLGRVIGALQRQLDEATRRMGVHGVDGKGAGARVDGKPAKVLARKSRKKAGAKKTTRKAAATSTAHDATRRSPARKSRKTTKRR